MNKKYGVIGHRGKLGSLLNQREGFVALECDITNPISIERALKYQAPVDVVVNCAGISSIDECEKDYDKAILVNVRGLHSIHKIFGDRVLNISSDHVYSGESWWSPAENKKVAPINNYGWSKAGAEAVSDVNGGKTLRLSRTVSLKDPDISKYIHKVMEMEEIFVPSFLHRNYVHRKFAVDGIEYMVRNWDKIPNKIVNYGGTENFNMYLFMKLLIGALDDDKFVHERTKDKFDAPRPKRGGLNISLAKKLGFPMCNMADTISKLVEDYYEF